MAMKFYSDKTMKFYDTAEACQKAEVEAKEAETREKIRKERELAAEKERKEKEMAVRKADAEKVEAARKALNEAQENYRKALEDFIKTHGSYHFTTTNVKDFPWFFDLFNLFP